MFMLINQHEQCIGTPYALPLLHWGCQWLYARILLNLKLSSLTYRILKNERNQGITPITRIWLLTPVTTSQLIRRDGAREAKFVSKQSTCVTKEVKPGKSTNHGIWTELPMEVRCTFAFLFLLSSDCIPLALLPLLAPIVESRTQESKMHFLLPLLIVEQLHSAN